MMPDDTRHARRFFLSRLGAASAAAGVVASVASVASPLSAKAQTAGPRAWLPLRHAEDDWLENAAAHRLIIDSTAPGGFDLATLFAGNYLNANNDAYGVKDA